ncbi:MAG: bi-domain-containing oxidoreductase [Sulfurifustis sp.]
MTEMRQITQNYKSGSIRVQTVNPPALKHGGVLVKTRYSVVSTGTEGMKVREAKMSYLGKARARPDQVKKVLQTLRQQGVMATYQKVMNKLDSLTPLGYSLSGTVVAVAPGAEEFRVGESVACGGAGYANHADVNFVPKNLVVPVPSNVSLKHAAFATVGAIALQGFRQSHVELGETACVIGLGLLGQLLVQILRSAGVRVIGVDVVESRCAMARSLGATLALQPTGDDAYRAAMSGTRGMGADCVFLCAGSNSNEPLELAVRVARDRARIVDIGKTRLDLPWNDCYLKELDLRFSRSYGPGRYDPNYEERGIDYPVGYVRWTERRNMAAFLDLVAEGKINLEPLVSVTMPFAQAETVYGDMAAGKLDGFGIVFEYEDGPVAETKASYIDELPERALRQAKADRVGVGVIGAGNYASSMLLPHLKRDDVRLMNVATTTSLSGANAVRKFGFEQSTTNVEDVLTNPEIDAVVIATRHASHAQLTARALRTGKATYVEKPLALTLEELVQIAQAIKESRNDRLMVGFNRRFAPMVEELAQAFRGPATPLVMVYRVHAGQMETGSWYLDAAEGSRFIGESGHFFDVFSYIAGSAPVAVSASCLRPADATADDLDNVVVTVRYENGSVGTLHYLTQGDAAVPKEYLEIFGGGRTAILQNFESLSVYRNNRAKKLKARRVDKGQRNEMACFVEAVKQGEPMPIPLRELFATTLCSLAAVESLRRDCAVVLADYYAPPSA